MADQQRIEALRRRVQADPTSIAFAQLAEELRRAGRPDEAIDVCRAGLAVHPTYMSARITLGRALLDLGHVEAAENELTAVLRYSPESLPALRALGEAFQRRGRLADALRQFTHAAAIAPNDPDLESVVAELSRKVGPDAARPGRAREQRTIEALEQWLDAIHVARANPRA